MVGHCSSFSPSYNKVARCREMVQHPCMHVWSMANASLGNIHLMGAGRVGAMEGMRDLSIVSVCQLWLLLGLCT